MAQVRTDVVRDRELLELMRRSGCELVYLGLESVNQATLDGYEKSQTVGDIVEGIRLLHEYDIRSHGMFVLGADTDDARTARHRPFAIDHAIDTLMLNILTPAPGTAAGSARWTPRDASSTSAGTSYDGQHVMMSPLRMTPAELQTELLAAYVLFYSLRRWLGHVTGRRWRNVRDHLWCWWFRAPLVQRPAQPAVPRRRSPAPRAAGPAEPSKLPAVADQPRLTSLA